jgi:hypothetical protein
MDALFVLLSRQASPAKATFFIVKGLPIIIVQLVIALLFAIVPDGQCYLIIFFRCMQDRRN